MVREGVASRLEHTPGLPIPTLVDTAMNALNLASPAARQQLFSELTQVSDDDVRGVMARYQECQTQPAPLQSSFRFS